MSGDDHAARSSEDEEDFDDDVTGQYEVDYVVERRLLSNECVYGDACCNPHVFHTANECSLPEDYEGGEG